MTHIKKNNASSGRPVPDVKVRLGTPAVTTRGMGVSEMREIAGLILRVLAQPGDVEELDRVRALVAALCERFPLYLGRGSA